MPLKSAYVPSDWRKVQNVVLERKIQVVEWRVRTIRGVSLLHVPCAMLLGKNVRAILKRQCKRSITEQKKLHWPAIHSATTLGKG